jgi:hypothetical protein
VPRDTGVSAWIRASEPALQRVAPDQGDLTVGRDPVTCPQLADQSNRLTRTWPTTDLNQLLSTRIDLPPTRIKRAQSKPLILAGHVQRVRPVPARAAVLRFRSLAQARAGRLNLVAEPLPRQLRQLPRSLAADPKALRHLIQIQALNSPLDRTADLLRNGTELRLQAFVIRAHHRIIAPPPKFGDRDVAPDEWIAAEAIVGSEAEPTNRAVAACSDYALPGGVFGKIADALIVKRLNGKSLEEGLHNFKALVERQ